MILSNTEVQSALGAGRIRIDPLPEPQRPEPSADCPYNTTAVDLRLHDEISIPRPDRPFTIDLSAGSFAGLYNAANYETIRLSPEQPFR